MRHTNGLRPRFDRRRLSDLRFPGRRPCMAALCLGFTLMELLVVVAVMAVLMATLLPSLSKAREMARRRACGSNLHGIGQGISNYAAAMEMRLPAIRPPKSASNFGKWSDPVQAGGGTSGIGLLYAGASSSFDGQPSTNMWLLVLFDFATPSQFICPSDPRNLTPADAAYATSIVRGTNVTFGTLSDGSQATTDRFSYSSPYVWTGPAPAKIANWWYGNIIDTTVVLAADIGPSKPPPPPNSPPLDDPTAPAGDPRSNSKNHGGKGQNVLYIDGHVDFCTSSRVGIHDDNIYDGDPTRDINGNLVENLWVKPATTNFLAGSGLNTQAVNSNAHLNFNPDDQILVPAYP